MSAFFVENSKKKMKSMGTVTLIDISLITV